MTLERELITSTGNTISIVSDDEKTVEHFENSNSFAEVVLSQINNDRIYDEIFDDDDSDLVVLDIGGNIGLFSLYLHDRCKAIYPIEPTPSHFSILEGLTNKFPNIKPLNVALHNEDGEIDFYISEENSTMNSSVNVYGKKVEVQARKLETIIQELGLDHVDFVKCDIEGSEMVALTEDTLRPVADKIDCWFVEVHATGTDLFDNKDELKARFEAVGYTVQDDYLPDALFCYKDE